MKTPKKPKTVSEKVSEPVSERTESLPLTDLPTDPLTAPPLPPFPQDYPPLAPAVLSRVPTALCVLAPGVNRGDLNLTPEFLADIAQRGVIQPLLVRHKLHSGEEPCYEIFAGARRWTAAIKLLQEEVPVAIYPPETPDADMAELRLIENLQREDLSALDEAAQYREALECPAYGVGRAAVIALGARVGKSASHIYSRLRLLKLPKPLLKAWTAGTVPQSIVELIAALPEEKDQLEALAHISEGEQLYDSATGKSSLACMSVRQARAYIAREFQSDLRKAIWALDDAELYPEAGPCSTCPFRGGHPEGAPGVDDPNACTRRSCYKKKRAYALREKFAEGADAGKTMLSLKDSEDLFHYGYVGSSGGYVEAASKCYHDKRGRTYEELLKAGKRESGKAGEGATALMVHAVNPETGELVKLFKSQGLNDALVAAGYDWAKPASGNGSRSKPKAESAETKAKREAEEAQAKQVEVRVIEAVMKVVETTKMSDRLHANLWAFVFSCIIDEIGEPTETFYHRRGIAQSSLDSIRNLSPKSNLVIGNVRGECLEYLLMDYSDYREDLLAKLAGLCGVDVKAIEAEVKKPARTVSGKVSKPVSEKKPAKKNAKVRAKLAALARARWAKVKAKAKS